MIVLFLSAGLGTGANTGAERLLHLFPQGRRLPAGMGRG